MDLQSRVAHIIEALKLAYPEALCALHSQKDYELMIAVRLSAQCTDERVNLVTPALFAEFPTLESFACADVARVEELVHSCGFYKHKARDIVLACQMLLSDYGGRVPDTMEALLKLPGVGRKTANLLLGDLYAVPGSVVCDTHCIRIAGKLGQRAQTSATASCCTAEPCAPRANPPASAARSRHTAPTGPAREACLQSRPEEGDPGESRGLLRPVTENSQIPSVKKVTKC